MSDFDWDKFFGLANSAVDEARRQHGLWGEQNHPDGTGLSQDAALADTVRNFTNLMASTGNLTWRDILWEEVREVFAETDPEPLTEELLQVAAVCLSWADAIKRRNQ
jgi:hypothetical protein